MLARLPTARMGEIQELSNLATFLVSDYSSWMTGEVHFSFFSFLYNTIQTKLITNIFFFFPLFKRLSLLMEVNHHSWQENLMLLQWLPKKNGTFLKAKLDKVIKNKLLFFYNTNISNILLPLF